MNSSESSHKSFYIKWMELRANNANTFLKIKGEFRNSKEEICTISINCEHNPNEKTPILTKKITMFFKNFINEENTQLSIYQSGEMKICELKDDNDVILPETNNKIELTSKNKLSWTIENKNHKSQQLDEPLPDPQQKNTDELKEIINKINASEKSNMIEQIAQTINSLSSLVFDAFSGTELALISESTANGAIPFFVKRVVAKAIPQNCDIDIKIITAYQNYAKNKYPQSLNVLKQGDCVFLDLGFLSFRGGHHITGIIKKTENNTYSLTIANSGYGSGDFHPIRKKNGKHYTVVTYKNIAEDKMELFFKQPTEWSLFLNPESKCKALYEKIDALNGELDIPNCHVDNAQIGGSCAGRQELLILKHVIPLKAYRQLKINLTENAVLYRAKIFHSTKMSTDRKILLLYYVRKLSKNYKKIENTEMEGLTRTTEKKILESLKNPQKTLLSNRNFFGSIPQKKSSCPQYDVFISGLKALQAGDFINSRNQIEEAFTFFKNKKNKFNLSNSEINILVNIAANFSNPKNEIFATPEEWDLIGGVISVLGLITHRIVNNKHNENNKAYEDLKVKFIKAKNKLVKNMRNHSHIKEESLWCSRLKKKNITKLIKKRN